VCDSEADDYSVTRSHERVRAEGEQHSTETKKRNTKTQIPAYFYFCSKIHLAREIFSE